VAYYSWYGAMGTASRRPVDRVSGNCGSIQKPRGSLSSSNDATVIRILAWLSLAAIIFLTTSPARAVVQVLEKLHQVQHGRVKGRGSAAFTQMRHEDLRRCFVAQALSWQRIQVMGEVDKLLLSDVGQIRIVRHEASNTLDPKSSQRRNRRSPALKAPVAAAATANRKSTKPLASLSKLSPSSRI
jgi:hypothetical protein